MDVRQRMKLTGTNRSIGLIILIRQCPPQKGAHQSQCPLKTSFQLAICRPGGSSGAAAPDPIPNSAVKRPSAHDTSSQDAGKSVAARSANRKLSRDLFFTPSTKAPRAQQPRGFLRSGGYESGEDGDGPARPDGSSCRRSASVDGSSSHLRSLQRALGVSGG